MDDLSTCISDPTTSANNLFKSFQQVTALLKALILQRDLFYPSTVEHEQTTAINKIKAQSRGDLTDEAAKLLENLPSDLQQSMAFVSEKGASILLVGSTSPN